MKLLRSLSSGSLPPEGEKIHPFSYNTRFHRTENGRPGIWVMDSREDALLLPTWGPSPRIVGVGGFEATRIPGFLASVDEREFFGKWKCGRDGN